jgi:hypothetical protein
MSKMSAFDQTIAHMAVEIEQAEGTCLLFGVTDDTELRDHAVKALRKRLPRHVALRHFRYSVGQLSLLEGVLASAASSRGRPAVSVTGLEALSHHERGAAFEQLNSQRNRLGSTGIAIILWVNRATLAEISTKAPDFYAWRSATLFVEPPLDWNVLASTRRSYLQALAARHEIVDFQGLSPMRGGQVVQMRMEDIFIPLRAEQEMKPDDGLSPAGRAAAAAAESGRDGRTGKTKEAQPEPGLTPLQRWTLDTRRQRQARPVEVSELLQEHRAVVLGDPGAGKTTLLRYVAYMLASVSTRSISSNSRKLRWTPSLHSVARCTTSH